MGQFYSQNEEERYIVAACCKSGQNTSFLDIGAYDGKAFSNTLRLAELGWKGVCVEPSPSVLPALKALHASNPRIVIEPVAIGATNGVAEFYDSGGDAVGTLDAKHMLKWKEGGGTKYTITKVPVMSVASLLAKHGTSFGFVNLDVEGKNMELFRLMPWAKFRYCRCICIEHEGNQREIARTLRPLGYSCAYTNAENVVFTR